MDKKELMVEYFKSLREEIHIRIRQHTQLVWIKIISLGATISFLLKTFYPHKASNCEGSSTSNLLYLVWAIPLAGIIFDFLIASNLRNVCNLGHYIKNLFEENAFRSYFDIPDFRFWEQVAGQGAPRHRCYTKGDMWIIWLFTLAAAIFSLLLRLQVGLSFADYILAATCAIGVIFAFEYLIFSLTMERDFHLYPEIGHVRLLQWKAAKVTVRRTLKRWFKTIWSVLKKRSKTIQSGGKKAVSSGVILEATPLFTTSGYDMKALYLSPNTEHKLGNGEFIICLLRGSITNEDLNLPLRQSQIVKKPGLKSSEDGCLLFVCKDTDPDAKCFDEIHGLEANWSEYDEHMYKTLPQIHVGGYKINLWYLGPNKHGGIHNHTDEPVPFIEFHTQLRGNGWMVKYEDRDGRNELERIKMERGYTHELFCKIEGSDVINIKDGIVIYPPHEYIAGEKGSLFIVFEDTRVH